MQYKFSPNQNYQDFAVGRVIYGRSGMPNFPVRLAQEIFCRCQEYLPEKSHLTLYDPCCGSGYLLTVLGYLNHNQIDMFVGSDIDQNAAELARQNLALLTWEGLMNRVSELQALYQEFGKVSHLEALQSAENLMAKIQNRAFVPRFEVFTADILAEQALADRNFKADIIIADVPYGSLVAWQGESGDAVNRLLKNLVPVLKPTTIVAVCTDKKQKVRTDLYRRLEQQTIGKRRFTLLRYNL